MDDAVASNNTHRLALALLDAPLNRCHRGADLIPASNLCEGHWTKHPNVHVAPTALSETTGVVLCAILGQKRGLELPAGIDLERGQRIVELTQPLRVCWRPIEAIRMWFRQRWLTTDVKPIKIPTTTTVP